MTTTLLIESLQSRTSAYLSIIKKNILGQQLGPLTVPKMVASLVEGEVIVAANGSGYVSEYINLTCFSIRRIKVFGR